MALRYSKGCSPPSPTVTSCCEFLADGDQTNKWTKAARERLPGWIATNVRPIIEAALASPSSTIFVSQRG